MEEKKAPNPPPPPHSWCWWPAWHGPPAARPNRSFARSLVAGTMVNPALSSLAWGGKAWVPASSRAPVLPNAAPGSWLALDRTGTRSIGRGLAGPTGNAGQGQQLLVPRACSHQKMSCAGGR